MKNPGEVCLAVVEVNKMEKRLCTSRWFKSEISALSERQKFGKVQTARCSWAYVHVPSTTTLSCSQLLLRALRGIYVELKVIK